MFIGFIVVALVYSLHQYVIQNYRYEFVDSNGKSIFVKNFFTENKQTDDNRVFIIGSSHVQSLNTTYIHDYLLKRNLNFSVYNFGTGSDDPVERSRIIDTMFLAKPKIIVYGISYRDFENPSLSNQQTLKTPLNYLPDPISLFKNLFLESKIPLTAFDFLRNPEGITLAAIDYFIPKKKSNEEQTFYPFPNAPYKIGKNDTVVLTDYELNHYYERNPYLFTTIDSVDNNSDMLALEEIISKIKKNNVKFIIFTTPQSGYFLKTLTNSDRKNFELILNKIGSEFNLRIYQFNNNYTKLNIWKDPTHVAINDNVTIYNDNISQLILKELES